MKVCINKRNIMKSFPMGYLLIYLFFSNIIFSDTLWLVLTMATLILLLMVGRYRQSLNENGSFMAVGGLCCVIYWLINGMAGESTTYLLSNMIQLVKVLVPVTIINIIDTDTLMYARKFICRKYIFINMFAIINLIIMILQLNIKYFMMKDEWFITSSLYEDHVSGFFGNCGTPHAMFFYSFLAIYNIYTINNVLKKHKSRQILRIMNIAEVVVAAIVFTKNDGKAYFLIAPIMTVIYYLSLKKSIGALSFKKLVKMLVLIGFIALAAFVVLNMTPVGDFFTNRVLNALKKMLMIDYRSAGGGNQRLAIIRYSLANGFGFGMGKGLGNANIRNIGLRSHGYLGYSHFGESSASSLIALCGMPFYLIYSYWMARVLLNGNKSSDLIKFVYVILIVASLFTVVYSSGKIMLIINFYVLILKLATSSYENIKN